MGGAMKETSSAPAAPESVQADSSGGMAFEQDEVAGARMAPAGYPTTATAAAGVPSPAPAPGKAAPPPPADGKKGEAASASDAPDAAPPASSSLPGAPAKLAGPLLVYTATLHLAIFEAEKVLDAAEKLAKDSGGYLVKRSDRSITIRIPAAKFDGSLGELSKLGDVLHREVDVRDVTDEFLDLNTRLRNYEVVRERLEQLMHQAAKVEDALAVERELERVTTEIEKMKGKVKLLKELIAFSTITLELQPRPVDQIDSQVHMPFPWLGSLGLSELLRL